eukprot:TRINITY_DN4175_c0_g1_i4.p1 TRINITY_DN4175_c0_g1~~TRINITY_DN4175_c0_g1_i4.p1  ORF type:complete len:426 (-),score=112.81 TRINITY_DN4175_c0_g1_i4:34-1311(-)
MSGHCSVDDTGGGTLPPDPATPSPCPSPIQTRALDAHLQIADSSYMDTKRFTVFPNGLRKSGKVFLYPVSDIEWRTFLQQVSKRMKLNVGKLFNEDGGEIEEYDVIMHDDVLYAAGPGEDFKMPDLEDNDGSGSSRDWVTLNVGGRIFSTTRSTLTRHSDSMLATMFGEHWNSSRDAAGSYLIDRTPEYFAPILNFLRCGILVIDDGVNPEGVLQEATFFNITPIMERLVGLVDRRAKKDAFSRRDVIAILLTSSTNASLRCQGLNLEGVDLSKLDLSHINFKMTNFRAANLSKCTLDNALLQEADLTKADLSGANLRGANLSGANLEGANLKGANFEDRGGVRAVLDGANLKDAVLEEVNFSGANLRVANLRRANMENCSLRGADLAGANLEDVNLRGANLHKANLTGANLRGANFDIRTVSSR